MEALEWQSQFCTSSARFLPSSELLLANADLRAAYNAADYVARNFTFRPLTIHSSVELANESGVYLSPEVLARLEEGTGFRFNLAKALRKLDGLRERDRVRYLQASQCALGCLGNRALIHTHWKQNEIGRLYASRPAILNLPKIVRGALEAPDDLLVAEIDFVNFELQILFVAADAEAPAQDVAAYIARAIGSSRDAVKIVLNPLLHGQTHGNLLGTRRWDELETRKRLEKFLMREFPQVWAAIESLPNRPEFLQRKGAELFFQAYHQALKCEDLAVAGIPMHDGWIFPTTGEAQVLRIKSIFTEVAHCILGRRLPVNHAILCNICNQVTLSQMLQI